ncbi:lipid storage droplets surface-binding protein 2-like isoform X1 [Neodiprion fabricii]|uniref:lipid storage droplets surface-binding protein 2-like isoform X1 n=1 Tax=Neodiprion fabricii TaxID=2872261 RepID=UPI001ED960DA|nr:lipid storage droplets surface-binding protein 2-like isoform X1 [Neodiprion fabricii]
MAMCRRDECHQLSHVSPDTRMAEAVKQTTEGIAESPESGPHLEVFDRVRNMPVVQSAIGMTGSTYNYVKESSDLLSWALNYAESGLHYASATAAPIATPIVKKFEGPINKVDQTLCKGLDIVEQQVSTAREQPQHVVEAARAVMNSSIAPALEKLTAAKDTATHQASSLKETALAKANEVLNNQFGAMAVQGVDNASAAVNRLLDQYFPAVTTGDQEVEPAPISAEENKVLHTVQTVGQLSTKTARRVYHSISAQLRTIKKEDVTAYMNSAMSILHLTQLLGSDKNSGNGALESEKKDDEQEIKEKQ